MAIITVEDAASGNSGTKALSDIIYQILEHYT